MLTLALRRSVFLVGLRRWLPSNMILGRLRRRRCLKFGVPAMLLALPYWLSAQWIYDQIQVGGLTPWMYPIALACGFSALKFAFFGPWSLVLLVRVRIAEAVARRRANADAEASRQPDAVNA